MIKEFEKLNNYQIVHLKHNDVHNMHELKAKIEYRKKWGSYQPHFCSQCWEIFKVLGLRND
jgi:hypothetical protein